jgi:phospholipase C
MVLSKKVKCVLVIFNENHSFYNEYGTFPGANGLFSMASSLGDAAHAPEFVQTRNRHGRRRANRPHVPGSA